MRKYFCRICLLLKASNASLSVRAGEARGLVSQVVMSIIVIATITLLPHQAIAEDYRWWRDGMGRFLPSSEPQLPAENCQYYIAKNKHIGGSSFFSRDDIYVCVYDYSDGTGGGIIYRRHGDSCPPDTIYNATTGGCGSDPQKGGPDIAGAQCAGYVGDPINTAVGNSFQTEVDAPSRYPSTLHFTRVYNSLDGVWRHNHSTYLRFGKNSLALVMADGRESFFTVNSATIPVTVTASRIERGRLTKAGDIWLYTAPNNDTYHFDATGRLTRWTNASGASHQLTYANGTVSVTDRLGNRLSFTEDTQHQPLSLTAEGLQITYGYNANRRLIQLTRTQGGQTSQRQLHYEDPRNNGLLTGLTDERGVRFTTWTFDFLGRATSSEHTGGAEHTQVTYNADGSRTVTNELGKRTVYRFVAIEGVKRVSAIEGEPSPNCLSSNSTFTYDTRGLLKTQTDNKGFVTTYAYNARGLEESRTEAFGTPEARTVTTTWHPTLNLRATVSEPALITTYHYDDQGRPTGQNVSER